MAVDTPATIAVVGAGPIGLEAALYARYLGYGVQIYERGEVGRHLLQFGHVRLFSPFGMNRSPLGLAALHSHDENWQPPPDDAIHSAREYVQSYLRPLAQSDLLLGQQGADCLDQKPCGPQTLLNPEPNFYILGAKSYGRNSKFLISLGLEQIRELFSVIGGRAELNLYATIRY